jgi:lipopolysaccharide biosynthesis glycosyltransferase
MGLAVCRIAYKNVTRSENKNYKKEEIPIVIALDDGYVYPALVSMHSMLSNASNRTFYTIYTMVPGEFKKESKVNKLRMVI